MKYNPDSTLELSDGKKIPLLFNTWTFRTFSQRMGLQFAQMVTGLTEKKIAENDISLLFLTAAQSWHRHNRVDFTADEIDADEWVDDLGGLMSPKLQEHYIKFISKLSGWSVDQIEVSVESAKNAQSL